MKAGEGFRAEIVRFVHYEHDGALLLFEEAGMAP
jgi:hypothetical protein